MELFRIKRDIPFMRHALVFNAVSLLTFLAAVFFLATRGLHLSIEFTGGTLVEARYAQAADIGKARHAIEGLNYGEVQVQNFGTSQDVLVRVPLRGDGKQQEVVSKVFGAMCAAEGGAVRQEQFVDNKGETLTRPACRTPQGQEPVQFKRSELVGPQVGSELARDGALA
ncbi:MAG: protein translocase subunit SecF, partial [Burkholderiaceae bacterium]